MGSKRPIGMEDRFVAYDPKKKTCNPADRNLIKRLAGKQGSETKKRRLRQEKAARMRTASANGANGSDSRVCDIPRDDRQYAASTYRQAAASASSPSINRDLLFPQHRIDNLWTPDTAGWQSPASHTSNQRSQADRNPGHTPLPSPSYPAVLTPTGSSHASNDYQDYFPPTNESVYGMHGGMVQPAEFALPQTGGCRTFGSFDSGFQDSDPFDVGLDGFPNLNDSTSQPHQTLDDDYLIDDRSTWPHFQPGTLDAVSQSLVETFPPQAVHHERTQQPSASTSLTTYPSPLSIVNTGVSVSTSEHEVDPCLHNASSGWQPSAYEGREGRNLRSTERTQWPNINRTLVERIQEKERLGELGGGSSSACLDALSQCDEARQLWQVNLSRLNPKLVLCPEQPNDIYARAKAKLKRMSPGQRLDVEGIMIRIAIVEYVAISLVLEVSSLVRDIGTRRDLKVSSSAVAVADYRLTGLSTPTRSIAKHLWPESAEAR